MTEADYILATNVQKFRVICDLLRDCLPGPGLSEAALADLEMKARAARDSLFAELHTE